MRLGTTTFSFTNEWLARPSRSSRCLSASGASGLGPGSNWSATRRGVGSRGSTPDEVLAFRRLVRPTRSGAGRARRVRRPPAAARPTDDVDEASTSSSPQIEARAAARVPAHPPPRGDPGPTSSSALVPVAEARRSHPGHRDPGGQTPDEPGGVVDRSSSASDSTRPAIALVLDFSVVDDAVPCGVRRRGQCVQDATPRSVDGARSALGVGCADARALRCDWPRSTLTDVARVEAQSGFVRFGRQDPAGLGAARAGDRIRAREVLGARRRRVDEPTSGPRSLLDVLGAGGFEGVVAVEWGGSAWLDADDGGRDSSSSPDTAAFCRAVISNGGPRGGVART